jgi:hypothetical protein
MAGGPEKTSGKVVSTPGIKPSGLPTVSESAKMVGLDRAMTTAASAASAKFPVRESALTKPPAAKPAGEASPKLDSAVAPASAVSDSEASVPPAIPVAKRAEAAPLPKKIPDEMISAPAADLVVPPALDDADPPAPKKPGTTIPGKQQDDLDPPPPAAIKLPDDVKVDLPGLPEAPTVKAAGVAGSTSKEPPIATNVPSGNHADDYSWVKGKLLRGLSRGGYVQVRYADHSQEDRHGGAVMLVGTVSDQYKDGDVVLVRGRIEGYDNRLRGTAYRIQSIEKVAP